MVPDSAILVSFFSLLGEVSSMYTHHILMWQRYIDDILIIWDSPERELKDCLNLMNQNSFNPFFYDDTWSSWGQFSGHYYPKKIPMVDLQVSYIGKKLPAILCYMWIVSTLTPWKNQFLLVSFYALKGIAVLMRISSENEMNWPPDCSVGGILNRPQKRHLIVLKIPPDEILSSKLKVRARKTR